jgi:anti-sigma regulatory factor (Ser/Thr protein kinase)
LAISDQLKKSESQRQLGELKQRIKYRETHFELTNDPSLITPLVTFLKDALSSADFCDETNRHRIGIAIQEAVDNALYHGNLELDSEICEQDMTKYYGLATERRQIDPYGERRIFITYKHSPDSIQYVIRDEGPGFDLDNLPDPTDPESMIRLTGRGLLLIRNYMDEVEHNDMGNQITMIKYRNGHT